MERFALACLACLQTSVAVAAGDEPPPLTLTVEKPDSTRLLKTTEAGRKWLANLSEQIRTHVPSSTNYFGGAGATAKFRVNRKGEIYDVEVANAATKEQADHIRWIFKLVHVPPPPVPAIGDECCFFVQPFVIEPAATASGGDKHNARQSDRR